MQYNKKNFKILDVLSYLDACSSSDEEYELLVGRKIACLLYILFFINFC